MKIKDYIFLGLTILGAIFLFINSAIMLGKYFDGEVSKFIGIFASAGWFIASILYIIMIRNWLNRDIDIYKAQAKLSEEYNNFVEKAQKALERAYGYNEQFDQSFSFYRKIIRDIGAPLGNSLCSFAEKIKDNDTIFLLRVDEEENCLYISVVGKTISIDQAREMADIFKRKIEEISGPDSIIQKKKFVPN